MTKAITTRTRHALSAQFQERRAKLGVRTVRELVDVSGDTKLATRRRSEAAELLGLLALLGKLPRTNKPEAVRVLTRMVRDDGRISAWSAATSLGYIGAPSSVPKLIHAAAGSVQKESRRAAIYALGFLGDRRAADVLARTLRNEKESKVRAEAAEALASCGRHSERALSALIGACKDPSARVRFFAAHALGIIRDTEAIPALESLALDRRVVPSHGSIAEEAARSLSELRRLADSSGKKRDQ